MKKLTWLQVYVLEDVRVIWCNSLCDEFCRLCDWLQYTYHLTCNSSLCASYTHYTSYSLLNIVHVIVCVFRFDQPSLKLLWVLFVQNIFCVWVFKGRIVENLNFGKTRFKTCVLEKHFISYSCFFNSYIQCFEVCFQKSGYFF